MRHRTIALAVCALWLHAPVLNAQDEAADEAVDESAASEQSVDADDPSAAPAEDTAEPAASGDDFRPSEQLRWDQEVDFPTDI